MKPSLNLVRFPWLKVYSPPGHIWGKKKNVKEGSFQLSNRAPAPAGYFIDMVILTERNVQINAVYLLCYFSLQRLHGIMSFACKHFTLI